MKKILYILFCICPLLFVPGNMAAQQCSADFTISSQITSSTCQSNGEIEVTLSGDLADFNTADTQYGLTSIIAGGFSIEPRTGNVLKNIPPGTYELTVRAFCKNDSNYDVIKKVTGLVVGGNYTVPVAAFNAASSRKPYTTCNTGIIALDVTGGNGTFTFSISSAPAGVTLGAVTPVQDGTLYTLPGENYPAGDYLIQVSDECYTAACNFTLEGISSFPVFQRENEEAIYPDVDNTKGSCNYIRWYGYSTYATNPDFKRYADDDMYEVAATKAGQTPTNWILWNKSSYMYLDISPYNASDFYAANSLEFYIRVKNCPSTSRSFTTYIKKPSFVASGGNISTRACDYYTYHISPNTTYNGVLCYPLNMNVTKTSTGTNIYSNPNWLYNVDQKIPVELEYDTSYTITATDQNGTTMTASVSSDRSFVFSNNRQECGGWRMHYAPPRYADTYTCLPINISVLGSDGIEVCTHNITTSEQAGYYHILPCLLEYGKTYTFKATYNGGYTYTTTRSQESTMPTAYTMTTHNTSDNKCNLDMGRFHVTSADSKYFPVGTVFTITGPAGFTTQTYTTISSSIGQYITPLGSDVINIPAGTYTLTANHGCGDPIVATYEIEGIYNYKNLDYTTEPTCSGLKVAPSGFITYKGIEQPDGTFYRLTDGPDGYDKSVKKPGESFIFSAAGTYTLGILVANSSSHCAIATRTIEYNPAQLALDINKTAAYVCVGETIGNISIKAINGVAPYTYELWNEANTTKVATDITTSDAAHFNYGNPNTSYTVRISDGCGNNFNQKVTLADLKTARIVHTAETQLCAGSTISLNCITLGNTTYNWTGPNGFTSTDQHPTLTNALDNMSGWYKVSVMPEYCGTAVEDSIYITVYPPLVAGAPVGDQTACVRTTPSVLSSETTGGKGTYAYQWQSSADGVSWANIPGATEDTYQPPVQLQAGTLYYRKESTDACGTVYSTPVSVAMRPCYIPVNHPNMGARP